MRAKEMDKDLQNRREEERNRNRKPENPFPLYVLKFNAHVCMFLDLKLSAQVSSEIAINTFGSKSNFIVLVDFQVKETSKR